MPQPSIRMWNKHTFSESLLTGDSGKQLQALASLGEERYILHDCGPTRC